jgi:hypothetical protein
MVFTAGPDKKEHDVPRKAQANGHRASVLTEAWQRRQENLRVLEP